MNEVDLAGIKPEEQKLHHHSTIFRDDANDDEEIPVTKRQSHHGTNYSNSRLDPTLGLETIQAAS